MKSKSLLAFCIICSFIIMPLASTAQTLPDSTFKKKDNLFQQWNTTVSTGCVVGVIRNDSLIYVKGVGMADLEHAIPITPSTIFYMASVSKQFAGYSIEFLASEGKIKLDEYVHVCVSWSS